MSQVIGWDDGLPIVGLAVGVPQSTGGFEAECGMGDAEGREPARLPAVRGLCSPKAGMVAWAAVLWCAVNVYDLGEVVGKGIRRGGG